MNSTGPTACIRLVVRWGSGQALKAAFLSHLFMWGIAGSVRIAFKVRMAYLIGLVIILGSCC